MFDDRLNRILRVAPSGGTPEELVRVGTNEQVLRPQILPGGDAVLFSLRSYGTRRGTRHRSSCNR